MTSFGFSTVVVFVASLQAGVRTALDTFRRSLGEPSIPE